MINNKILLVTGASSEVGVNLIRKIGGNYGKIWAHYNSSSNLIENLREQLGEKIIPVQADFSSLDSTLAMIEKIRSTEKFPDHIVHLSAPKARNLQFHKHTWDNYQREIDISLRSITMILQEFIPKMSKQNMGKLYSCSQHIL